MLSAPLSAACRASSGSRMPLTISGPFHCSRDPRDVLPRDACVEVPAKPSPSEVLELLPQTPSSGSKLPKGHGRVDGPRRPMPRRGRGGSTWPVLPPASGEPDEPRRGNRDSGCREPQGRRSEATSLCIPPRCAFSIIPETNSRSLTMYSWNQNGLLGLSPRPHRLRSGAQLSKGRMGTPALSRGRACGLEPRPVGRRGRTGQPAPVEPAIPAAPRTGTSTGRSTTRRAAPAAAM